MFTLQLGPGVDAQRVGGVFFGIVAALAIENRIGGDMQQARSAPGDIMCQFAGTSVFSCCAWSGSVSQASTFASAAQWITQSGWDLIQHALHCAGCQQIGLEDGESLRPEQMAVHLAKDGMLFGHFKRQV